MIGKLTMNDSKIIQPYISLSLLFFFTDETQKKSPQKSYSYSFNGFIYFINFIKQTGPLLKSYFLKKNLMQFNIQKT